VIRSQGKYFSEHELNRIVMLLYDSDMSLTEIANRMECSRSAVASINRKFQIRVYAGRRSEWRINREDQATTAPLDTGPSTLGSRNSLTAISRSVLLTQS